MLKLILPLFCFQCLYGIRGGAGPDPSWHKYGCGLNKLNSIQDFVSCGQYLINNGLIHKNQLSALGISAGCLLVGAAVNMHPELFRAAILKVCSNAEYYKTSHNSLPSISLNHFITETELIELWKKLTEHFS